MSLGVGVPALLVGLFGDGYLHVTGAQADRLLLFIQIANDRLHTFYMLFLWERLNCRIVPYHFCYLNVLSAQGQCILCICIIF